MAVIVETLTMQDKFSASFGKYIKLAEEGTASTKELNDAIKKVNQDASMFATTSRLAAAQSEATAAAARARAAETAALAAQERLEAQRARAAAQAANEQAKAHEKETQAAGGLVDKIKGLVGAYAGLQGLKTLVNMSDEMTQINSRLQLMTGSAEAAAAAQEKIFQAAQRSRGAYTDLAGLVSQLGMMAPDTFGSTDELIAFAEQLQKQMAISGASGQSAAAAMTQLTQALASGTLRGDELNSVLEQTPMIAKTIADYMGLTTGQLRDVAAEGQVTADIVKNAMLSAADETDAAFESMPMTWSQVWTTMQNAALDALQPIFGGISTLANNLDIVAPAVLGVAGAFGSLALALNASKLATEALTNAQKVLNIVMSANPVMLIISAVILLVGAFYSVIAAINQFTGASISATALITGAFAWAGAFIANIFLAVFNAIIQLAWSVLAYPIITIVEFITNIFTGGFNGIGGAFLNLLGNMISWLMEFAKTATKIIDTIFGSDLTGALTGLQDKVESWGTNDNYVKYDRGTPGAPRLDMTDAFDAGYNFGKNFKIPNPFDFGSGVGNGINLGSIPGMADLTSSVDSVGSDVNAIKKEVSLSDENLKELVDVATGKYVNQINLTSQTPVINVNGQNTGKTKEDRQALGDALKTLLAEQLAAGAAGAMALPI